MAKKIANNKQVQAEMTELTSLSNDVLQPFNNSTVTPRFAVIGKGIKRNNLLLPHILQADIQRWYPWSRIGSKIQKALKLGTTHPDKPDVFIGWGHKKSYQRANKEAKRQQLTTLSVEDGFLRSLQSGIDSRQALSVVVDDLGIYFDLNHQSRLEQLILQRTHIPASLAQAAAESLRAERLMARIIDEQLSKYNAVIACPSLDKIIAEDNSYNSSVLTSHVLLIDQVQGDASIKGAGADKKQFKRMLKAAYRNHPNAHIWIKAHPASIKGYLTSLKLPKNVRVLKQALNPIALLAQVDHVYTVSSHMGFEALMLGKSVHCFGVSWYSGWGLTEDTGAPQPLLNKAILRRQQRSESFRPAPESKNPTKLSFYQRGKNRLSLMKKKPTAVIESSLATLFYSAYIDYSYYADPVTKQACDIDNAIDWLVTNRYWSLRLEGNLTVYEFSRWKLPFVRAFIDLPRTSLFVKPKPRLKNLLHPDHFRADYRQPLLVWGLAKRQQLESKLKNSKLKRGQSKSHSRNSDSDQLDLSTATPPIYTMEDGFIRSNGLGATLLAPLSVVVDKRGIYYDATQPSDLEILLRDCQPLSAKQLQRIEQLRDKLLTQRVSKYNVGTRATDNQNNNTLAKSNNEISGNSKISWLSAAQATNKTRLLIVGQVEDDLSVQYCGSAIKTNSDLIERVRQDHPDAYLIYKPHPDVEVGLRSGQVAAKILQQVDAVAHDTAMPDCLAQVDEVHTISSLTGFEALLRDLTVICYGLPFYAGWGLTVDVDADLPPKALYMQRRQRSTPLTLEQLIQCTLIAYPLYRLPEGYGLAQVEQVIDYLYPSSASDSATSSESGAAQPSLSIAKSKLAQKIQSVKRQAATRFMQQRHQLKQLLQKPNK